MAALSICYCTFVGIFFEILLLVPFFFFWLCSFLARGSVFGFRSKPRAWKVGPFSCCHESGIHMPWLFVGIFRSHFSEGRAHQRRAASRGAAVRHPVAENHRDCRCFSGPRQRLGPPAKGCPTSHPFFGWESSPTKIDKKKKVGTNLF